MNIHESDIGLYCSIKNKESMYLDCVQVLMVYFCSFPVYFRYLPVFPFDYANIRDIETFLRVNSN